MAAGTTASLFAVDRILKRLDHNLSVHLHGRVTVREGVRPVRGVFGMEHYMERLGGVDRLVQPDYDVLILTLPEGRLTDRLGNLRSAAAIVSVDGYPAVGWADGCVADSKRRPGAGLVFEA